MIFIYSFPYLDGITHEQAIIRRQFSICSSRGEFLAYEKEEKIN